MRLRHKFIIYNKNDFSKIEKICLKFLFQFYLKQIFEINFFLNFYSLLPTNCIMAKQYNLLCTENRDKIYMKSNNITWLIHLSIILSLNFVMFGGKKNQWPHINDVNIQGLLHELK